MKPNLYKQSMMDAIVKAFDIAIQNKEFNDYFEKIGINILGVEGIGIRNDKKDGLIISLKDTSTDAIKHVEINPVVKTQLYESFIDHVDYETQVRVYEQTTGNKVDSKAKNKVTYNFETLSDNIKNKVGDINDLASELFE